MGMLDRLRKAAADKIAPKQTYGNMERGHELRVKLTRDAECKRNIAAFLSAGIDYSNASLVDEGDRYACTVNGLVIGRCHREDYEAIRQFAPVRCSAVMRDYDGNMWSACTVYES